MHTIYISSLPKVFLAHFVLTVDNSVVCMKKFISLVTIVLHSNQKHRTCLSMFQPWSEVLKSS